MTIVVAGGSGFIGTMLTKRLLGQGHTVVVVATTAPSFTHKELFFIQCDLAHQSLPYNILEHADAVINLAGFPINKKWTPENKNAILESRTKSTETIIDAISKAKSRPTVFICASATGFYGDTGEEMADEQTGIGDSFLAGVVAEWEAAARKATEYGVRVVCIRTAPVIGRGGFLAHLKQIAKFGILPRLKKNDFWFSWISDIDIVNVYLFALETTTLQGVVNAAAPEPVRYSELLQQLKKVWRHRFIMTIPQWIGKRKFGEGYEEMTNDSRVIPRRLLDKGFEFVFPTIDGAIAHTTETIDNKQNEEN
ncbi:MAG TPA: TIGR01777 family oxidoreductase [Candidatus Paceibacterota bacterium]|jgi:uncharacterized protein (TIGR01777 family)|nr:TIGR01777 family oxidoreductase [Candidatus Paceibacterota bacterium]